MGLNIGFNYGNFDFNTFFYGCLETKYSTITKIATDIYSSGRPKSKTALYDSWTPQHHDATAPIQEISVNFSNSEAVNSYALENGSYFRNKTMILGYNFPKSWLEKIKIERFRIYVQAVNLFTITNYSGLDPELPSIGTSAFGIDFIGKYPNNQKQYLIGFNLGF